MRSAAEVLILGGGLAGSAAAVTLAAAGRRVLLVEREPGPRHRVCGEFLSAEALHLLRRLGVDAEARGAPPVDTVRLAEGRHVAEAPLPFAARSLTRCGLDGLLLRSAEEAGARVERGAVVEELKVAEGGGWRATLRGGEVREARQVILATGKHDLRGFLRPRGVQGDLVAMKMYFQLRPDQMQELGQAVELLLHPEGYTGLQAVEGGRANLTTLVRRQRLAQLGGWAGLFMELCRSNAQAARRLRGAEALLDRPLGLSAIPYGFVRREAIAPGLRAVGDQAAVIPSFTGDGMSIALYSGLEAALSLLRGESAAMFQQRLYRTLRPQVTRATALSRALVHPWAKPVLVAGARVWPGGLRVAARGTRLPGVAMKDLA